MRRVVSFLWIAACVAAAAPAGAQVRVAARAPAPGPSAPAAEAVRVIRGERVAEAPVLDGRLDDAAWAGAEAVTDFVQMRPEPGAPATERTEARVVFDDDALYVGMRMYDRTPARIAAQLGRRDAVQLHSDWAHVLIDSYHDRRTAFRFSVNPRGLQKDVLHYDDWAEDVNWDAVWSSATRVDSLGWTAELRIPLSQLRFSDAAEGERVWGVNFSREIARRGEMSWWSPVLPTVQGTVSQAGELRGLEGLGGVRRLELLPYAVSQLTRAPGDKADPLHEPNQAGLALGGDLKYGLTSNLTLSATVNPDFGQVEADPSVVNLSGFETFFPEKRPFFVEGSNIFSFRMGVDDNSGEGLFYSRRIGRAPQRPVSDGAAWSDVPEATTILAAGKLSGKTSTGWTVGLLSAVTEREAARLAGREGRIWTEAVEPLTSYTVASLARDFRRGASGVGIMATATHRRLGDDDAFAFLRRAAYTAGVSGRHRFAAETWEASAYAGASHVRGSAESIRRVQEAAGHYFQRPDARHLELDSTRTSLSGAVANFWVGKIGGGRVRGGVGGHLRTPGLEVNDLGYQQAADQALLFGNLALNQFEPRGVFRRWNVGINPSVGWTTGGERAWTQLGHWANFDLQSFWSGGWWMGRRFEALAPGALRGGPAMVAPPGYRFDSWLNSDSRKPLRLGVGWWGGWEFEGGSWDYGVETGASYRPSARLNLSVKPRYSRTHNTWQYVARPKVGTGGREYLVGLLDQHTLSLTTRVNYTISPTLSLEVYAQPFVSAGGYTDFRRVTAPRAERFDERFTPLAAPRLARDAAEAKYRADVDGDGATDFTFDDPDFNVKQFRSNAVLRWEYRPGSTLFVVWSQGRSDRLVDGSFDPDRDLGRLFGREDDLSVPATNVLLVKVSYWFNP